MKKLLLALLALLAASVTSVKALQVQDLNVPGESSQAWALNNVGQVVGSYVLNGQDHAFLWRNEKITDLGDFTAYAINDNGMMAGFYRDPVSSQPRAAVMSASMVMTIIQFCDSWALGISNTGYVTGHGCDGQAFRYQLGGKLEYITDPAGLKASVGFGQSVNNQGVVGGYFSSGGFDRPFVFNSTVTILGDPVYAINSVSNSGTMTGRSNTWGPFIMRGDGRVKYITLPAGSFGRFESVNDLGDAAGWCITASGYWHGIAYRNGITVDLINEGVTRCSQINNLSQIAGVVGVPGMSGSKAVLIFP